MLVSPNIITKVVSSCKVFQLKHLTIERDEALLNVDHFVRWIPYCKNLESLEMWITRISDMAITQYRGTMLKKLYISNKRYITPAGVKHLALRIWKIFYRYRGR